MRLRSPGLFALGFVTALSLGGGIAYAANGGAMLIGKSNAATATTSLANSAGSALSLTSKTGTSPLRVNSATKVANLNADELDGVDSTSFALRTGKSGIVLGAETDADGYVNTARCPSGSVATGGGGYATGIRDFLAYSGPDFNADGTLIPNSWFAAADGDAYAWVVCYNPRGAVAGATSKVLAPLSSASATAFGAQKRVPSRTARASS